MEAERHLLAHHGPATTAAAAPAVRRSRVSILASLGLMAAPTARAGRNATVIVRVRVIAPAVAPRTAAWSRR